MISSKNPLGNVLHQIIENTPDKLVNGLYKGSIAFLRLIRKYETFKRGVGYCYMHQKDIGMELGEHGHKAVCVRQVKKYCKQLIDLGLIKCKKPRTRHELLCKTFSKSRYSTNTTVLGKKLLQYIDSKENNLCQFPVQKSAPLILSKINLIAKENESDLKKGKSAALSINTIPKKHDSEKDNKCKLTSNSQQLNDKMGSLMRTNEGEKIMFESSFEKHLSNAQNESNKSNRHDGAVRAQNLRIAATERAEARLRQEGRGYPMWSPGKDPLKHYDDIAEYGNRLSQYVMQEIRGS